MKLRHGRLEQYSAIQLDSLSLSFISSRLTPCPNLQYKLSGGILYALLTLSGERSQIKGACAINK